MFGSRDRVLAYEETTGNGYAVKARSAEGADTVAEATDAPPEAFVQKISDEGGDVYMSPMIEMLRRVLRRRRGGDEADDADATSGAVGGATLQPPTENDEVLGRGR